MLEKNSSIPLYKQLKNKILDEIQYLKNDSKIKSEKDYSDKYGISRITIRKAIDELVKENYLIRIGGKGTFVLKKKGSLEFSQVISFTVDMEKLGHKVYSKVLDFNIIKPTDNLVNILDIGKNENIFYLDRIRLANGKAMAIQKSYIVYKYCPNLIDYDFSRLSLYKALEDNFNIRLSSANNILEVRPSSDEENRIFGLKNNIAVIILKQTTFMENGIPIEYVESIFRGDKYNFQNMGLNLKSNN